MNRVLNSNKLRTMRLCDKAFSKFRQNALSKQKFGQYKANLIYMRLKNNIGSRIITRYHQSMLKA